MKKVEGPTTIISPSINETVIRPCLASRTNAAGGSGLKLKIHETLKLLKKLQKTFTLCLSFFLCQKHPTTLIWWLNFTPWLDCFSPLMNIKRKNFLRVHSGSGLTVTRLGADSRTWSSLCGQHISAHRLSLKDLLLGTSLCCRWRVSVLTPLTGHGWGYTAWLKCTRRPHCHLICCHLRLKSLISDI